MTSVDRRTPWQVTEASVTSATDVRGGGSTGRSIRGTAEMPREVTSRSRVRCRPAVNFCRREASYVTSGPNIVTQQKMSFVLEPSVEKRTKKESRIGRIS